MAAEFDRPGDTRPAWWVALRIIHARPGFFTVCVIFATLHFCMPLAVGLVTRAFFDVLTGNAPAGLDIPTVIALFIVVAVADMGAGAGLDYGFSSVKYAGMALMRRNLLRELLRAHGARGLIDSPGEAMSRFRDDTEEIADSMDGLIDLIGRTFFAAGAMIVMYQIDPARFAWNIRFLELCGDYRVEPVACAPGRPRTKGKVERPFFYLEQHLLKGGAWADLDAFADDLLRFSAACDALVHGTTGERPIDWFERARDLLTPLPTRPFIGTHEAVRKVSWDCLVSFGGSRYSVPWSDAA